MTEQDYKEKIIQLLNGFDVERLRRVGLLINGMIGGTVDDE